MAKPTDLGTWNTDGTNRTVPAAPQKATGWTSHQKAVSSYFNWFMNVGFQWFTWINAGVWDAVSLVLTGALTGVSAVFSSTVTATRHLYTTPRSRRVPLTLISDNAAANSCTTHARGYGSIILAASTNKLYAPIPVCDAEVITSYRVSVQKNDSNADVSCRIISNNDGTVTGETSGAVAAAAFSGSTIAVTENCALQGGKNYYVEITPGGSITPAADRILNVRFSFSEPV